MVYQEIIGSRQTIFILLHYLKIQTIILGNMYYFVHKIEVCLAVPKRELYQPFRTGH